MKIEIMKKAEGIFEVIFLISLLLIFLNLIKSFLIPLLLAATFVFLTYGFYQKLSFNLGNKDLSAFIILFLVLGLIFLPLYFVSTALITQATTFVTNENVFTENINLVFCDYSFCRTLEDKIKFINFDSDYFVNLMANYFSNSAIYIFNSISTFFIGFFIFLLAFYFLLIDGDKFLATLKKIIPMRSSYKYALFLRFRDVTSAVFIDSLLVAMVQGILVSLGFIFFGLPSPIFWGVIATFFALIPMLGAAIIWFPAALYLFFTGSLFSAIGLVIYGAIIISLSDNLLRPMLLKNKIQVHPFLIMLSILGGLEVFSFFGIFLGPIIISLLVSVVQLYKLDFR